MFGMDEFHRPILHTQTHRFQYIPIFSSQNFKVRRAIERCQRGRSREENKNTLKREMLQR